jgi:hypothetical protein
LGHVGGKVSIVGDPFSRDVFSLTAIALPNLESVDGSMEIGAFLNLTSLELPRLVSVGTPLSSTSLSIGLTGLVQLSLPALTRVEFLLIQRNASLTNLEMPALVDLFAGNADISGNPLLTTCVGDAIVKLR